MTVKTIYRKWPSLIFREKSISSASKALMISNTGGKTDVIISGCTFIVNAEVTEALLESKPNKRKLKEAY